MPAKGLWYLLGKGRESHFFREKLLRGDLRFCGSQSADLPTEAREGGLHETWAGSLWGFDAGYTTKSPISQRSMQEHSAQTGRGIKRTICIQHAEIKKKKKKEIPLQTNESENFGSLFSTSAGCFYSSSLLARNPSCLLARVSPSSSLQMLHTTDLREFRG